MSTDELTPPDAGEEQQDAAEEQEQQAPWPEDWRERAAGGDEKKLKRLSRYTDPNAALDALIHAQNKISSGEYRRPRPDNPSEEELAMWRKENGVPESAEDYDFGEVVIGENDQELVSEFIRDVAHPSDLRPDQMQKAVSWYLNFSERQAQKRHDADQQYLAESAQALRDEWGHDYAANANLMTAAFLDQGQDFHDLLITARDADGNLLINNPTMAKGFAKMAREINPVGTLVPGSVGNSLGSIDDKIAKYETMMREDRKAWNKDQNAQSEYQALLAARDRLTARR